MKRLEEASQIKGRGSRINLRSPLLARPASYRWKTLVSSSPAPRSSPVLTWPHEETASRPLSVNGPLTAEQPACMRAVLSPIWPYCANVRWLSSGRLAKASYPYAGEPRSRRDLSPDGVLGLPAHPLWSHIAGGGEDQWASAITSSPLHNFLSFTSKGGPAGPAVHLAAAHREK